MTEDSYFNYERMYLKLAVASAKSNNKKIKVKVGCGAVLEIDENYFPFMGNLLACENAQETNNPYKCQAKILSSQTRLV